MPRFAGDPVFGDSDETFAREFRGAEIPQYVVLPEPGTGGVPGGFPGVKVDVNTDDIARALKEGLENAADKMANMTQQQLDARTEQIKVNTDTIKSMMGPLGMRLLGAGGLAFLGVASVVNPAVPFQVMLGIGGLGLQALTALINQIITITQGYKQRKSNERERQKDREQQEKEREKDRQLQEKHFEIQERLRTDELRQRELESRAAADIARLRAETEAAAAQAQKIYQNKKLTNKQVQQLMRNTARRISEYRKHENAIRQRVMEERSKLSHQRQTRRVKAESATLGEKITAVEKNLEELTELEDEVQQLADAEEVENKLAQIRETIKKFAVVHTGFGQIKSAHKKHPWQIKGSAAAKKRMAYLRSLRK